METLLTIVHIAVCFFLVVIVLLQQGKGANMGATFGGSSQTVFGSEGPLPLLNKVTTMAAITFMVTSISLAYLSAHKSTSSVMKDFSVQKPGESAIERSAEPLPQQPAPDMPLIPADQQPATSAAPAEDKTAADAPAGLSVQEQAPAATRQAAPSEEQQTEKQPAADKK